MIDRDRDHAAAWGNGWVIGEFQIVLLGLLHDPERAMSDNPLWGLLPPISPWWPLNQTCWRSMPGLSSQSAGEKSLRRSSRDTVPRHVDDGAGLEVMKEMFIIVE